MNEPIHESGAEGGCRRRCAGCQRVVDGKGCDAGCADAQVSGKELAYILGRSRPWVTRAEGREVFKRANKGHRPSYLWRTVKEGMVAHYGAYVRETLPGAERRFREVISGGVARKRVLGNRAKGSKKRKRKG